MTETVELHHRIDGPEDAPWLVLSNSLGTSLAMWDRQIPAFTEHFRVLRYDTRGHGASPVPPGPYTLDDIGADVLALFDRLGIERASFAGVSLGGMTAIWLASEAPDRIDRVVPSFTSSLLGPKSMWDERAAAVRSDGIESIADAVVARWMTPEGDPDTRAWLRDMLVATDDEGYAGGCEAVRDMDLRERLGRVRAATLVIAGEEDPATPPEHGQAIADGIEGARMTVLPGAAHLGNVEQPEAYNRAVLEHLMART
jgi:3-oxoadipate enol-lactonase